MTVVSHINKKINKKSDSPGTWKTAETNVGKEKMSWKIKRIQEDDYGCEERPQNEKITVIVTLVDENGMEKQLRVEDDWLYAEGINEGDLWLDTFLV